MCRKEVTEDNVDKFVKQLQPPLASGAHPTVWAVGPAELLSDEAVHEIVKRAKANRQRVVLVGCGKVWGLERAQVIYHTPMDSAMRTRLARNLGVDLPRASAMVRTCQYDLRQLRIMATFGCDQSDTGKHVWRDTCRILSGATALPTEYYNPLWLEHNVATGLPPSRLGDLATFYSHLAIADVVETGTWDTTVEGDELTRHIIRHGLNVSKLAKHRTTVTAPLPMHPMSRLNPRKWSKEMLVIHGTTPTPLVEEVPEEPDIVLIEKPYALAQTARRKDLLRHRVEKGVALVADMHAKPCTISADLRESTGVQESGAQKRCNPGVSSSSVYEHVVEERGISIGPSDMPGAQLDLGMDPYLALNAGRSSSAPCVDAPAVAPVADVVKKEGRTEIVQCPEQHLNVGRASATNFFGIKAAEL
jgi:hypothetical protein